MTHTTTRPRWAWLFFFHLALVISATVLASAGRFPAVVFQPPTDKIGHLFAYGGLAFFAVAFFGARRRGRVIAAVAIAAALEELSQRAFPARTFDLGDLAMNAVGIALGGWLACRLALRRQE
jgi:VanZ family protein